MWPGSRGRGSVALLSGSVPGQAGAMAKKNERAGTAEIKSLILFFNVLCLYRCNSIYNILYL